MVWHTLIAAKLYPGYGLVYVNCSQTIPQAQFGYDLCMPNHTLGVVCHGEMGLPVTSAHNTKCLRFP